jgi:hypothetical protein
MGSRNQSDEWPEKRQFNGIDKAEMAKKRELELDGGPQVDQESDVSWFSCGVHVNVQAGVQVPRADTSLTCWHVTHVLTSWTNFLNLQKRMME